MEHRIEFLEIGWIGGWADDWYQFPLIYLGKPIESARKKMPRTMELLEKDKSEEEIVNLLIKMLKDANKIFKDKMVINMINYLPTTPYEVISGRIGGLLGRKDYLSYLFL